MIGKLIDALMRLILPPDGEDEYCTPRPFDDGEILVRSAGPSEEAQRA